MTQSISIEEPKSKGNFNLIVSLIFGFFPISFIIGNLAINLNLIVFTSLAIYYLRLEIFTFRYNFFLKILLLFFITVFVSSTLSYIEKVIFWWFW